MKRLAWLALLATSALAQQRIDEEYTRQNTQGSYALVMNAIMNWDHLR
jgi:hypothetical protein